MAQRTSLIAARATCTMAWSRARYRRCKAGPSANVATVAGPTGRAKAEPRIPRPVYKDPSARRPSPYCGSQKHRRDDKDDGCKDEQDRHCIDPPVSGPAVTVTLFHLRSSSSVKVPKPFGERIVAPDAPCVGRAALAAALAAGRGSGWESPCIAPGQRTFARGSSTSAGLPPKIHARSAGAAANPTRIPQCRRRSVLRNSHPGR